MNASFVTYFPRFVVHLPEEPSEISIRIFLRSVGSKKKIKWIKDNMPNHIEMREKRVFISQDALSCYEIYARK